MHNLLLLAASTSATTTSGSKSSSSSSAIFLFLVVILALFYFVVMRPQSRKARAARLQARQYEVGDEVVAAGMIGQVVAIEDGEVEVEVADGLVLLFVPQAVQSRTGFNAAQTRGRQGLGAPARPSAGPPAAATTDGPTEAKTQVDDVPDVIPPDQDAV
jgi:preprotein translocase subunit YajC